MDEIQWVILGIVHPWWEYDDDHQTPTHRGDVFCVNKSQHADSIFWPRILSKTADFRLANKLIKHCACKHKDCQEPSVQIEGLQLIDCESQEQAAIAVPPGKPYAALGYFRGETAPETSFAQRVKNAKWQLEHWNCGTCWWISIALFRSPKLASK